MERLESKLGQIAFSISDHRDTISWYQDVFGFEQAGRDRFSGSIVDKIVGLHGVDLEAWWLIGRTVGFQLEFFKVRNPPARPRSRSWRACDIGYTMFGIHVHDFDSTLDRVASRSGSALPTPIGEAGHRRICAVDPDGVIVEIMEDDPIPDDHGATDSGPAVRFLTMSVPDLDEAKRFAVEGLGLEEATSEPLHYPAHEAMWGLGGARRRQALYRAGSVLLELVQYEDPVGRPWPDNHRITDIGILNIAYVYEERWQLTRLFRRATGTGFKANNPDLADLGNVLVMYGTDPQGFSMELVQIAQTHYPETGFTARPCGKVVTCAIAIAASPETIWQCISRLDRSADWTAGYQSRLFREGHIDKYGLGAIRELHNDHNWILEEVIAVDPGRKLSLAARSGRPTENHLSTFTLVEVGGEIEVSHIISYTDGESEDDDIQHQIAASAMTDLRRLKRLCESGAGDE